MVERETVSSLQVIKYHGPFSVSELYKTIDTWLGDHRYDKRDKEHNEAVKPDGRYIEISMRPWRSVSNSDKFVIWIDVKLSAVKDIEVKVDGHKRKLQQGEVWIGIRGYLDRDSEGKWESNPLYMLLRTTFNRFIYDASATQYIGEFSAHLNDLNHELKNFLNLYKKRTT